MYVFFFFFNDTATTEIYTLSLHDALPISRGDGSGPGARLDRLLGARARRPRDRVHPVGVPAGAGLQLPEPLARRRARDRKSTRLNSSHSQISYAVFCLKKKNPTHKHTLSY